MRRKHKEWKIQIDLPEQKIWKALEDFGVESSSNSQKKLSCRKAEEVGDLLDKAFDLLLQKLIRQN